MGIIIFTLNIVAPIFLLILLGIFLKQIGFVNQTFISQSSAFVFTISLPALIFLKIATINITKAFDVELIVTSLLIVLLIALISWVLSSFIVKFPRDKGVFVQGSFRSNFAIIGLALIAKLLGENELGRASLLLAFVMPLYNILAVIVLTLPLRQNKEKNIPLIFKTIVKNPLILSAVVAIPFSVFMIPIGSIAATTLNYLGKIALPLALISIGASLNFAELKKASKISIVAAANKIITFPAIAVTIGILLGFDKDQLAILFVLFASPTAVASFVMADAMGSNSKLAGDIIVLTTLFSILTIGTGIVILKYYSLI